MRLQRYRSHVFLYCVNTLMYNFNYWDCFCADCLKETTVGKIDNGSCYYISVNGIFYKNNTCVKQLSGKDIGDVRDRDI